MAPRRYDIDLLRAFRRLLPTAPGSRRRALVVLGVLVSVAVIVALVAATPAAPRRAQVAAPSGPPASRAGAPSGESPTVDDGGASAGDPSGGPAPGQGGGPGAQTPPVEPGGSTGGPTGRSGAARPPAGAPGDEDATSYAFPVSPARVASYGRVHHTYPATDIFAPCGTRAVSPVDGIVLEISRTDRWEPATDTGDSRGGLSVTVLGADGVRYYGSHLATIAQGLQVEDQVAAGQAIGTVGHTGSARGVPCHLHFGISPPCGIGDWAVRRGVVYPWPYLDAWKRGERRSPADEVWRWRDAHDAACPMTA